jgi:hypothetical protein
MQVLHIKDSDLLIPVILLDYNILSQVEYKQLFYEFLSKLLLKFEFYICECACDMTWKHRLNLLYVFNWKIFLYCMLFP